MARFCRSLELAKWTQCYMSQLSSHECVTLGTRLCIYRQTSSLSHVQFSSYSYRDSSHRHFHTRVMRKKFSGNVLLGNVRNFSASAALSAINEKIVDAGSVANTDSINNINIAPINSDPVSWTDAIEYIPAPPISLDEISAPLLNALGEATFASQGLGGWWPIGLVQHGLEFLHVSLHLPWWAAIAVATVIMRISIFPLVLKSQKGTTQMANNMPQMQILQMKLSEARLAGDSMAAAVASHELMVFMKEKGISAWSSMMPMFIQAPIFISMFIGLRRCANLPVESMRYGGLSWFTDLTVADPFFILPLITATTLWVTIELNADVAVMPSGNQHLMKWVMRGLPIIMFPFIMNFPAAILCYWVTTNMFSLGQSQFLKIPSVRTFFHLEKLVKHDSSLLQSLPEKKGFVEGFRESYRNMRVAGEIGERHRLDEIRFKKAGMGPIVKTYKYDPTKRNVIDVEAKSKSE